VDLKGLLTNFQSQVDPNLLVGMETFDDAGVYRLSDEIALVQTVDYITPLVDDPFAFGQIAAANSLSDIYAMGARPLTALNCCNFPAEGITNATLVKILEGGFSKILESGAVLVGGHTIKDAELKYGLAVTGLVHPKKIITNAGAKPGDALILTKPIGTGVIVHAKKTKGLGSDELLSRIIHMMATLNKVSCEVMLNFDIHACTDITGFGFLGHSLNIARESSVELEFNFKDIPHFSESLEFIREGVRTGVTKSNKEMVDPFVTFDPKLTEEERWLLVDPQTSGGLLISVENSQKNALLLSLQQAGVNDAKIVGRVNESSIGKIKIRK
jgi:selenide,water dikinase